MLSSVKGVAHGKTIQLDEEPGPPDGERVNVTLELVAPLDAQATDQMKQMLRRAAGAWSDDIDGLNRYLEWNRGRRNAGRSELAQ
jgi:hypothetical protein